MKKRMTPGHLASALSAWAYIHVYSRFRLNTITGGLNVSWALWLLRSGGFKAYEDLTGDHRDHLFHDLSGNPTVSVDEFAWFMGRLKDLYVKRGGDPEKFPVRKDECGGLLW